MSETKELIQRINASPYFGIFVEVGAGMPVASAIYAVPGASNTVYSALSPYSKAAQSEIFGEDDNRSVSKEHVANDILKLVKRYAFPPSANPDINLIYHSSFQLGEPGSHTVSHGWLGIAVKRPGASVWSMTMIHMTLKQMARPETIAMLEERCVKILGAVLLEEALPVSCGIDIVSDTTFNEVQSDLHWTDQLETVLNTLGDNDCVVIANGALLRLEEVFRAPSIIALYKGSFAPVTIAHTKFAKAFETETGIKPVFMISMDTFDKGTQQAGSVIWRINLLNKLGYTVAVNRNGYFYQNAQFFKERFGKPVAFLVGSDTLNRTIDYAKNKGRVESVKRVFVKGEEIQWSFKNDTAFDDVMFFVANRPNVPLLPEADDERVKVIVDLEDISSTAVRAFRKNNDIDSLRAMMPAEVIDDYLNIMI